ncbi:MAG: beta-ketoacyl synthase N-terminal-like domain-containing protein, partial [Bacteroidota bacterium]|nr:beta-ketoacyl synthase N-terminal-like domain-containing protein [Bacteroidota bacterium]
MNKAYVTGENVITSLGFTSQDVFSRMRRDEQGFRNDHGMKVSLPLVPLSLVNDLELDRRFELAGRIPGRAKTLSFSRLEKLFAVSIHEAVHELSLDLTSPDTLLILSTTKGNIKFLEEGKAETDEFHRLYLWDSGKILQEFFHFAHPPVIIANACISGSLAIGMASLYVKAGLYKNVIVSGADLLSEFVVSGFLSFQALSPEPCKPFDKDRNGLSLGEGCGTIVLSSEIPAGESVIEVAGFASSDDANHISGPSRTGEELAFAIQKAMNQANVDPAHLDFISSHGTATAY